MKPLRALLAVTVLPLVFAGWSVFHLELTASYPEVDGTVATAPETVWLEFSAVPDPERSSFTIRGPEGAVKLGEIGVGSSPEILQAAVEGAMPAGSYTVSWVGAPMDDHSVRGRYEFTVAPAR